MLLIILIQFFCLSGASYASLITDVLGDIQKINMIKSRHKIQKNNSLGIQEICNRKKETDFLLGCCKPDNVKIMENVMVKNGEFHVNGKLNLKYKDTSLPPLYSRYDRQVSTFSMKVVVDNQLVIPQGCKSYFNGTLHVSSRGTIHNLFHALNDNILPIVAQIVTDMVMWPEAANWPRMGLVGFQIPAQHRSRASEQSLPHLLLFNELFNGGTVAVNDANGMCFRRVIWGLGLRLHYVDAMVVLRRLTADFARALAIRAYNPPIPPAFRVLQQQRKGDLVVDGKPLNVLLVSRGSQGTGRTIQNEQLILSKLSEAGASVALLGDNRGNLTNQLSLALHSNVIVGLHGAGLVHGIFAPRGCVIIELKTLYGYDSDLFLRTSDSRQGTHVHIDARKPYSTPGEVHRVDEALADRVLRSLVMALKLQKEGNIGKVVKISEGSDDYVIGPARSDDELADFMGPPAATVHSVCEHKLPYWSFREKVLKAGKLDYCSLCGEE